MLNIEYKPNKAQDKVWDAWDNDKSTSILTGGGVNSGKSYNLMAMAVVKSLQYPGTRYLVGRKNLTNLMKTTASTLWKLMREFGLKVDAHYTYNGSSRVVKFINGSEILFDHLTFEPSDPDVARLGGLELTAAFLDEVADCDYRVIEVVHQRVGRCKNAEYSIKPMVFMTCNPSRGWLYSKFYKPWQQNELKPHQAFLPATIFDNPHASKEYIENLKNTLTPAERDRMLHGSWEFGNDDSQLTTFENIMAMYDYAQPDTWKGKYYITLDVAFESDKMILILWNGLDVVKIREIDKDTEKPEDVVLAMQKEFKVQQGNVIYDATGSGNYLKNYLRNGYAFHSGARPIKAINKKEFQHLKDQCYYLLAEQINKGNVRIFDNNLKDELIDECMQIKSLPKEKLEGKVKLIKKDTIKSMIGRSPDILDALAMRMVKEIKGQSTIYAF